MEKIRDERKEEGEIKGGREGRESQRQRQKPINTYSNFRDKKKR